MKIDQLDERNYETWKIQVEAILIKNDAWGYVNGSIIKPAEPAEAAKWEIGDSKAKSDLILSISPGELRHLRGCKTSREVWMKLHNIHASKGPAKKATLLKELLLHKLEEGGDIREHVMRFFDVKSKLADMDIDMHDDLTSIMLLYSLPSSFDNFRCAIESRDSLPDPETLKIKVLEEEHSRNRKECVDKALLVKGRRSFKPKSGTESGNNRFRYKCFKCHQFGHKASECKRNKEQGDTAKCVSNDIELPDTDSNFVTFNCISDVRAVCNENGSWIIDSGCTSHLCNDAGKFGNTLLPSSGKLNLATNSNTDVQGKGTVRLLTCDNGSKTIVQLPNTLFVPDLRCSLISVAKITDQGFSVTFEKGMASVKDSHGNTTLVANRKGNLYYVEEHCASVSAISERKVDIRLWHERLGHLNAKDLVRILNKSGINVKMTDVSELYDCDICLKGKMSMLPFPNSNGPCNEKLRIVHSDVCGPMQHTSINGAKYFVTFIDDCTRWCEVYFLSKKSEVFNTFKIYKNHVENLFGRKITYLHTDNGGEYCNRDFDEFLNREGIARRLTVPGVPQQNAVAERKNRTLIEMARCMLISSGLSPGFWADAVATACHVRNRCPTRSLDGEIPFERWFERPVKVNYFHKFGSKVHVLDKTVGKDKFAPRSLEGIFVGYPRDRKGYRVWIPKQRQVIMSRDVKFQEESIDSGTDKDLMIDPFVINNSEDSVNTSKQPITVEVEFHPTQVNGNPVVQIFDHEGECIDRTESEAADASQEAPVDVRDLTDDSDIATKPSQHDHHQDDVQVDGGRVMKRGPGRPRVERGHVGRPRKIYHMIDVEPEIPMEEEVESTEEFADCEDYVGVAEISLKQALSGNEGKGWKDSILSEVKSLLKNDTFDIVNKPKGRNVVGCRYVLSTKLNVDKTEKKKARLVAKGFSQRHGIDYQDTFAPVARLDTVRLLVALAVELDLEIHQLDINTAYLNGLLEEEIYMKVPDILEECLQDLKRTEESGSAIHERASKMLSDLKSGGDVCRLKRSLYGLKQAGRQWNIRLDEQLKCMGLQVSLNEPCLYYKDIDSQTKLFVLVYVDDILVASQRGECIELFKRELATKFELKDYGVAKFMLGIEFDRYDFGIKLSQQKYIEDLLLKYNMDKCNPISTPMEVKNNIVKSNEKCSESEPYPYREIVGSLMYLSTGTRPDITNTVSILSQYLDCPNKQCWDAAKRVLRYLKNTRNYGLIFRKTGKSLQGYSDADWGGCLIDRRSYSGYVFMLGGGCVSWKSQKQKCVATSSCESEYISLASSMKEAIYLNSLLTEIGLRKFAPLSLHVDNQGAICLAGDPMFHSRSKHIDIRYHFIRSVLKNNKSIELSYISTDSMLADILTKALPKVKHYKCMRGLGIAC